MDTIASLLTELWGRLTDAEGELFELIGMRVYNTWAIPDATMPYLVHRLELNATGDVFPMRQGSYIVDIWDYSPNVDRLLSIREQIITLLDELEFSNTEVAAGRIWLQTDGQIPEPEQGIQHYSLLFNIRLYRVAETAAIIGR